MKGYHAETARACDIRLPNRQDGNVRLGHKQTFPPN